MASNVVDVLANTGIEINLISLYYRLLPEGYGNEREITAKLNSTKSKSLHDKIRLLLEDVAVRISESSNNDFTVRMLADALKQCNLYESVETLLKKFALDERISTRKLKTVLFGVREPVQSFTGREIQLTKIHKAICEKKTQSGNITVISQLTTVSGLGGIGKSELCRKYIQNQKQISFCNVVWINAESQKSIQSSIFRLADKIGTGSHTPDNDVKPISQIIHEVYQFFATQPTLFVFDNLDRKEDLVPYIQYHGLTPKQRKPYILVTSRLSEWDDSVFVLNLGCFEVDEAIQLISTSLKIDSICYTGEDVKILAQTLECFPLAIQQAIAFIRHTNKVDPGYNVRSYINQFNTLSHKLLDSDLFKSLVNTYDKTTYTTWKITLQTISQQDYGHVATNILDVMAFLQADNVDSAIFKYILEKLGKNIEVSESVALLVKYSMISPEFDQTRLSIHRLVQTVVRADLKMQNKSTNIVRTILQVANQKHHIVLYNNQDLLNSVWSHVNDFPSLVGECYFKSRYINGMTPLHVLSESGHERAIGTITRILNDGWFGSSRLARAVNETDSLNRTPVWLAANSGYASIVKLFISLGANLNIPANIAMYYYFSKIINHARVGGVTCLHISSHLGHTDCVKIILKANPDLINLKTNFGATCLGLAIESGNESIVSLLKPGELPYMLHTSLLRHKNNNTLGEVEDSINKYSLGSPGEIINMGVDYYSLYTRAMIVGCPIEFLKFLEHHGAKHQVLPGENSLLFATSNGEVHTSKYLVEKYNMLPSDVVNDDGWTVLHSVCQNGHLSLLKYFIEEVENMSVNITDYFKKDSLLHTASFNGQYDVVKFLLQKDGDYNAKNVWGMSPVMSAALNGKFDVVCLFLEKQDLKVDMAENDIDSLPTLLSELGFSLLHFAAAYDNVRILKELIQNKNVPVDVGKNKCVTSLHIAVIFNSPNAASYLVSHGADVNAKLDFGNFINALNICNQNKSILFSSSVVKWLDFIHLKRNWVDYSLTITPISLLKLDRFANSDLLLTLTKHQNITYNFNFSNLLIKTMLSFSEIKRVLDTVIDFVNKRKFKDHYDVVSGENDAVVIRAFLEI